MSLLDLMVELAYLRRAIAEAESTRRPSRLARWVASIRRRWSDWIAARKPRPARPSSPGVFDPWID
jgi:hypothetical protein